MHEYGIPSQAAECPDTEVGTARQARATNDSTGCEASTSDFTDEVIRRVRAKCGRVKCA